MGESKMREEETINIIAGIEDWVINDCGEIKVGQEKEFQLESYRPIIVKSNQSIKLLKQIFLNRYCFAGEIIAILGEEVLIGEKSPTVYEIIVDCGIPIKLIFGEGYKTNGSGFGFPIYKGLYISGSCDIYCLTCANIGTLRKAVKGIVTNLKKYSINYFGNKNFGEIEEVNIFIPFEEKDYLLFVGIDIKKVGELESDIGNRARKLL